MKNEHIEQIDHFLKSEGFQDQDLINDLKDHLATEIDFLMNEGHAFDNAFEKAKTKLLPDTPYDLEKDLKLLTTQKHNIMMKKVAYIGGYLSVLALTLTLLFFGMSFQNELKIKRRVEIAETEILRYGLNEESSLSVQDIYDQTASIKLKSLNQLETSQNLLIISIILFITTYLPYRFYNGYQKSNLELA